MPVGRLQPFFNEKHNAINLYDLNILLFRVWIEVVEVVLVSACTRTLLVSPYSQPYPHSLVLFLFLIVSE